MLVLSSLLRRVSADTKWEPREPHTLQMPTCIQQQRVALAPPPHGTPHEVPCAPLGNRVRLQLGRVVGYWVISRQRRLNNLNVQPKVSAWDHEEEIVTPNNHKESQSALGRVTEGQLGGPPCALT